MLLITSCEGVKFGLAQGATSARFINALMASGRLKLKQEMSRSCDTYILRSALIQHY